MARGRARRSRSTVAEGGGTGTDRDEGPAWLQPAPPEWSPAPRPSATQLLRNPDAYADGWDYPPEDLSAADLVRWKAPEAQAALEERLRRGDLTGGGFVEGLKTALEHELGQDIGELMERQPLVWFNADMLDFEFGYFDGGDTWAPVVEGSQWVQVMAVGLDRFAVEASRAVVFGADHIYDWLTEGSWDRDRPEVVVDEEAEGWEALWRGRCWPLEAVTGRGGEYPPVWVTPSRQAMEAYSPAGGL